MNLTEGFFTAGPSINPHDDVFTQKSAFHASVDHVVILVLRDASSRNLQLHRSTSTPERPQSAHPQPIHYPQFAMTTPRVFLLPKATPDSPNFTVISLPHPRTSAPTRFLLHPDTGLHEITKVAPTATAPRSWLLAGAPNDTGGKKAPTDWLGDGQIIQDASLYVSTPVDPLFILLPRLLPEVTLKAHFLPLDDVLDTFTATNDDAEDGADKSHWEAALKPGSVARRQVEARIRVVCDTVDVDGEMAYRPSQEKVLALLVTKCEEMAKGGLPKSMEDAFVVKPLARPISEAQPQGEEGEEVGKEDDDVVMEETTRTTLVVVGKPSEEAKKDEETADEENTTPKPRNSLPPVPKATIQLLRIRVASQFLSASYLSTHLSALLVTALASAHDFTPLDAYLTELKRLRSEALSLRSDDFSMKRSHDEDGEDTGAGKRQKKEEEEEAEKKRKKNVSRGVRDLGKVNTRGMAKMTSFFKKKE